MIDTSINNNPIHVFRDFEIFTREKISSRVCGCWFRTRNSFPVSFDFISGDPISRHLPTYIMKQSSQMGMDALAFTFSTGFVKGLTSPTMNVCLRPLSVCAFLSCCMRFIFFSISLLFPHSTCMPLSFCW